MDRDHLAEIAADKAILLSALQLAAAIQEIRDVESLLERLLSEIRGCIPQIG
jgi:hypothetical protein